MSDNVIADMMNYRTTLLNHEMWCKMFGFICADLRFIMVWYREEEKQSAKIKILILYAAKGANYLSPSFWVPDALLNFSCYRLTENLSQITTLF